MAHCATGLTTGSQGDSGVEIEGAGTSVLILLSEDGTTDTTGVCGV